jgi:glutathione S-transferase
MPSQTQQPTTTVWLWPTGVFPRRVIYYLRAKNITTSTLHEKNIHLIPVTLSNGTLASRPSLEPRPADKSLPVLRIVYADGTTFWIHETSAILGYFEEVFSVAAGYPDLRGENMQQRARTHDVLSVLANAGMWSGVTLVHSNANTTSWSGLAADEMSESAAVHARGKFRALLAQLEKWVQGDVVGDGSKSLSGAGASVTLADLCLVAQVEYMREMYGLDWVEGHGVLAAWCERKKGEEWVVGREVLKEVEETGEWTKILKQ